MSDSSSPLFRVEGLEVSYGAARVVHGIDLFVGSGETVALLGRNGAGKTSTLAGLAGLVDAHCETLELDGQDMRSSPAYRRARAGISLVPAGGRLFKSMTVRENLEIVRGARTGPQFTLDEVFELFPQIANFPDRQAGALSGGERQMVAIGRALMARPVMLLLDEPSEGLAPIVVERLGESIRLLQHRGLGILLCEQNHRFSLSLANRSYFIEKGLILHEGPAERALEDGAVERYLGV